MKTKLLLLVSILITFSASSQLQKNVGVNQKNIHNLNAEPISIGNANDVIAAFNLFDATMGGEELGLQRIDAAGAIVWMQSYANTSIGRARVFDIATHLDLIFLTGSIVDGGINRMFIAVVDGINGNFINAVIFNPVSTGFHSTPLKIIFTQSDATGNSTSDPGLLVTGFFSNCPPVDTSCSLNIGYVLRTDINLNVLWSIELESMISSSVDYDFINGVVETADGFFLTGSVTGELSPGVFGQGVLAHKIDFLGVNQWDSSYIFGNSRDVSVDAYYENGNNEIYMLTNYSSSHHFGVTVLNNTTGAVVTTKSWYASSSFLDFYGFKLISSGSSTNNLLIYGYNRENTVTPTSDQTNPFVYEFDMATGVQSGNSYLYKLPHTEPTGDMFNFWGSQLPLIYYPDMAFLYIATSGAASYAFGGYRTDGSGFTNMEIFATPLNKENQCDRENLTFTANALPALTPITTVSSGGVPTSTTPLTLTNTAITYTEGSCDPLSVNDYNFNEIKLFPNPFSERIYITGQEIKSIMVMDSTGKVIINLSNYTPENGIDIVDFSSGLYFVKVESVNNTIQTFKIVKE